MERIEIQNLKCGGCANTIKRKLEKMEGVSIVQIEVENSAVLFHMDVENRIHEVKASLKDMGYPPIDDNNGFSVKAKSYVSCAIGRMSQH